MPPSYLSNSEVAAPINEDQRRYYLSPIISFHLNILVIPYQLDVGGIGDGTSPSSPNHVLN
jgi:hypothetical protein